MKLTNVSFKPYQPRAMLSNSLSVPDVHLVTLRPNMEGLIVPSKFYGVAAAGRPTIFLGDLDGEIARNLRDFECGIAVAPDDTDGLVTAIRKYVDDPALAARHGANARKMAVSVFRSESVGQQMGPAYLASVESAGRQKRSGLFVCRAKPAPVLQHSLIVGPARSDAHTRGSR